VYFWNSSVGNFSFVGEFFAFSGGDNAGQSISVGDFNGDGFDDFVLGGTGAEGGCLNGSGSGCGSGVEGGCLNGSGSGCGSGVVYFWNSSVGNFSFVGEFFAFNDNDQAGWGIGVGDFNNDSFDDFVLGSIRAEGGCLGGSGTDCGAGVVYLWNSSVGTFSFLGELFGFSGGDFAGQSVGVGDFNNDGFADVVLGAYRAEGGCLGGDESNCGSGVVYLWNSSIANFTFLGELFGVTNSDNAGRGIGVGDFNNDSYDDVVLGAYRAEGGCLNGSQLTNCGAGVIYLWNSSISNFTFLTEVFGSGEGDEASHGIGSGDFNGDGFADLVLGAQNAEDGCLNGSQLSGCGSSVVYLWNASIGNFSFVSELFGVQTCDGIICWKLVESVY